MKHAFNKHIGKLKSEIFELVPTFLKSKVVFFDKLTFNSLPDSVSFLSGIVVT